MKLLMNICAHDGIISHYTGVGTIVRRYIKAFLNILESENIEYDINLFTPRYYENSFGYSEYTKKIHSSMKRTNIFQIENGSNGEINYGKPENWKLLSINTAKKINRIKLNDYDLVITIANDTPYAGLLEMLDKNTKHFKIWIPHSTGKIHKVDSAVRDSAKLLSTRIEWEMEAIDFINKDKNSYLGSTGKYIFRHLMDEYKLNEEKNIFIINGEILSEKTNYEETNEMEKLFSEICDYRSIILSFGRAEEYKNLDATMYLGKKLNIKPVVIAQPYYIGQPIISEYEKVANITNSKLFVNVPFYFPQYIINHFDKLMILLIPSKKEIVGLIINEVRKMNKDNVLIVANDIGGMHEQIRDNFDGVLVNLNDIESSAKKIEQVFNETSLMKFNKNSQIRLKNDYDFEKICKKCLNFFIIQGGL